jgi:hypothetical protein
MPPPAASFKAVGAAPSTNHVQRIRRSFPLIRGLAAAAVVALAALGVWYAWPRTGAPTPVSPAPSRSRPLDVVYRNEVASGFKIDWECKQNREFAGTYWWVLGQGLLLHTQDIPPNVAVLGLTWGRAITPKTVYLLARVDEKEVMVFADRLADDPGQTWPAHSELHLFRETVGELVLYEVTPLEEPYLLKHFYQPEMDPEWLKLPPYPGLPH